MLDDLALIAVIVETGSFVRAGERVGLTQSAISRAVQRLEERIGVRLFDRNARAVTLTDDGRRFHERVTPLLSAIDDTIDDASNAKGRVRGKLRINVDPLFARPFLAPQVNTFLSLYPDVDLELVVRDHADNFIAEGFDAAIRFGDPTETGMIARRLLQTRIITSASPAYVKRYGHPKHPRELSTKHECIQFRDPRTGLPYAWEFHQGKKRIVVPTKGRFLVNDGDTALAAALAGHGIGQFMELTTSALLRRGDLVDLFPRWHDELFPLYVLLPSKRHQPAKVRAFLEMLNESLRGYATESAR